MRRTSSRRKRGVTQGDGDGHGTRRGKATSYEKMQKAVEQKEEESSASIVWNRVGLKQAETVVQVGAERRNEAT